MPECANESVFTSVSGFFFVPFLGGEFFSFCFLFCPIPVCLFLCYYIIFYYYPFHACLLSSKKQKVGESEQDWRWEELGGAEGREVVIRIYHMKKKSIFIKRFT